MLETIVGNKLCNAGNTSKSWEEDWNDLLYLIRLQRMLITRPGTIHNTTLNIIFRHTYFDSRYTRTIILIIPKTYKIYHLPTYLSLLSKPNFDFAFYFIFYSWEISYIHCPIIYPHFGADTSVARRTAFVGTVDNSIFLGLESNFSRISVRLLTI